MVLKFSVTQVMIGHLNTRQSCELLQRLGYDALELRVRYTTGEDDITPDNVLRRADEIRSVVAEHGLVLSNFASNQSLDGDGALEVVRKLAEGAAACGCPAIRLGCRGYPADGSEDYWEIFHSAVKQVSLSLSLPPSLPLSLSVSLSLSLSLSDSLHSTPRRSRSRAPTA